MDHEDKPFYRAAEDCFSGESRFGALTQEVLEGVDPQNVSYQGDICSVLLWSEWVQMLNTLPDLGEVFVLTGNPCAILGHTREYPSLEFCNSLRHASCGDGTFDLEFMPWASAALVTRRGPNYLSHFIEFRDETNAVIHKVCLTDKTSKARFVQWTQYHQALRGVPPTTSSAFPPGRWRTVQQRHWFDYDTIDEVHPLAVKHVLQSALEQERPINVVVGNEGVVQSGTFVPKRLNPAQTWVFAGDEKVGLHFDQTAITDVIIHHTPAYEGGPALSALKCFDEEGCLRLAITPPFTVLDEGWNDFLDQATASV